VEALRQEAVAAEGTAAAAEQRAVGLQAELGASKAALSEKAAVEARAGELEKERAALKVIACTAYMRPLPFNL
jgi:transcription elongation GreA/GreB family factor